MTKHEIVKAIALETQQPIEVVDKIVNKTFKMIADAAINGESTFVRGFATFKHTRLQPKKARNISQGTMLQLSSRNTLKLKLCNDFKKKINRTNGTATA
jgi:nucleoid DNA-binding protein